MSHAIKIVDLNPLVPEDQMYDLLCEKFSNFADVTVDIAHQNKGRVAYLNFKTSDDARLALKQNSCLVLFGYACRAVPVHEKPGNRASAGTDSLARDDYFPDDADDYTAESYRKSEADRDRATLSPNERSLKDSSPPKHARGGSFSFRNAGRLSRGSRWQSSGPRPLGTRGKPYLLTPGRLRGKQKPYILTKSRDGDDGEQKATASDEGAETEPNSTLYIGSMDRSVTELDLKRLFNNFGFVMHVEIKIPSSTLCYAFIHFLTMDMACLAKREMEGRSIGRSIPKLGFGRSVESKCLWVGGLGRDWTSEDMLRLEFSQFGQIEKVEWPKNRDYAYVLFMSIQDAADAKQVMHGSLHGDPPHQIKVTYASSLQVNSQINYKPVFPKFPKAPRPPDSKPKPKGFVPTLAKSRFTEKRKSRDRDSRDRDRDSHWRRRRSADRSRSRSHLRRSRSHGRSRKKERTPPSPYTRSISQESSDNNMSAISETTSESNGSLEQSRSRQRKSRRKSSVSRSSASKLLRNPSPPKAAMKDERTVVLRSEPQPVGGAPGIAPDAFTSVLNQMPTAAVPSYVSPVDPVVYYPTVASTLPPPVYPPPVHIPPPDFYMSHNPVMMPYPQHLPPLASYPSVAAESTQPVPAVSQSNVSPVAQTNKYLPSKPADKMQQDASPAKETKKAASVGVATKFPKVWSGALVLRNAAFVVDFHLLSGSVLLINTLLGSNIEPGTEADCPVLKIAQRLRLDQPDKLDELDRRLKKAGRAGCSVLLATSTPAQVDDDANVVQQYPLSSLVSYLLQKQVAAVVSLPPGTADAAKASGVLHAFPPCKFASDFLHREAPGLPTNCPTEEELLVILCEF